jgi:calcineurin-like phosphoesterase
MCGPDNSILGVRCDRVIDKLRLHLSRKFEYAEGEVSATGAIFTLENGKTVDVKAVKF